MSVPIFGLCSEHLSLVFRGIGFIRFQTRRNATTFTVADANIDITRSIFVRSRRRSTTHRLKRSSSMWSQQFAGKRICLQCSTIFPPVAWHSVQTLCTMFSRKDFFRLFGSLLRISFRKTNAEPRCSTLLGGHDGAIRAAKHLELAHAYHLANPYMDLTNSLWGTKC